MEDIKFYRTVITYEVLSEGPYDFEVENLAFDVIEGDCSGMTLDIVSEEVSPEKMSELLIAQGSDPEFLLGEDYEQDYEQEAE